MTAAASCRFSSFLLGPAASTYTHICVHTCISEGDRLLVTTSLFSPNQITRPSFPSL